jgi:mono/diheme cytochrome c family protein
MSGTRFFSSLLLAGALGAAPARAADFEGGERVYRSRCSGCHEASFDGQARKLPANQRQRGAPDLGALAKTVPAERLRTWVAWPWKVNPQTACDIRNLSEPQKEDVVAFVLALVKPLPKPEQERFREDLESVLAERAATRGTAPSGSTPPKRAPTGGSKKQGER